MLLFCFAWVELILVALVAFGCFDCFVLLGLIALGALVGRFVVFGRLRC